MAFMGMFIVFVLFLIVAGLVGTMIIAFIIGMAARKKKPVLSGVMLAISGVIFALFAAVGIFIAVPKDKPIETPGGEQTVKSNHVKRYTESVQNCDYDEIGALLEKYPPLLYCTDINSLDALQYYANKNNFEGVRYMLDRGARFDNGVTLDRRITEYAIVDYFSDRENGSHEATVRMLKLMIDNGADVNYTDAVYSDHTSALFNVVYWAVSDDEIDEYEVEAARLIVSAGVDKAKRSAEDKTAAEVYLDLFNGRNDGLAAAFFREIADSDAIIADSESADNAARY